MTREDITRAAQTAARGFNFDVSKWDKSTWKFIEKFACLIEEIERNRCYEFIDVLVEAEREACAKVCETKHFSSPVREFGAKDCAAAIRARGEQA